MWANNKRNTYGIFFFVVQKPNSVLDRLDLGIYDITYNVIYVCVFGGWGGTGWAGAWASVALLIQHAKRMCQFWLHHIFRYYLIKGTILGKKVTEHKMCYFDFLYKVFLKYSTF